MIYQQIAIIGAGAVGSTIAYALMLKNITSRIVLIDIDTMHCQGEVLDLSYALPFCASSQVISGTPKQAGQSRIIIISAGIPQKPGQSRTELFKTNKKVIDTIIKQIQPINPQSIIIVVTNPVDALTTYVQSLVESPRNQVFGTGTFLDSQRLRGLLQSMLGVAQKSIHVYMIGEHGDTQFAAWSSAQLAGVPLTTFPGIEPQILDQLVIQVRQKALEIISCKGATYYGISACVAAMCDNIVYDKKRVLSLSCYQENFGICLSMPVALSGYGIAPMPHIPLTYEEQKLLSKSATAIQATLKS